MNDDAEMKSEVAETTSDKSVNQPKKLALWKKIAIGVVIFFVGVMAMAFLFTRGAQEAGDEFIADLQAGNCSAIYDRTTEEFQSITTTENWEEGCSTVGPILQGTPDAQGVSVNADTETGQTSQVRYRIEGTDGLFYEVSLSLQKIDGQWRLDGLNSEEETTSDEVQQEQPQESNPI